MTQKGPGKKWDSRTTDKNTVDNVNSIPDRPTVDNVNSSNTKKDKEETNVDNVNIRLDRPTFDNIQGWLGVPTGNNQYKSGTVDNIHNSSTKKEKQLFTLSTVVSSYNNGKQDNHPQELVENLPQALETECYRYGKITWK